MTRLVIVFVLMISLTGCLARFPSGPDSDNAETFSKGLKLLKNRGDTSTLQTLADSQNESVWQESSRSVLSIYANQKKKINSLQQKNNALSKENKKLQGDLDKLNQINLELEKRAN